MEIPRPEHPRPDARRDDWTSLNGPWAFAFDDDDRGLREDWHQVAAADVTDRAGPFDRTIVVPFAYQTEASGIAGADGHETVWYARVLPAVEHGPDRRVLLHVGASDHDTTVWVNGTWVGHHVGGYTPVTVDVTPALRGDDDVCVIRVHDALDDLEKPRGKQYWRSRPEYIFYTGTTGIWQSVWLEIVHRAAVEGFTFEPRLDHAAVDVTVDLTPAARGSTLRVTITLDDTVVARDEIAVVGSRLRRRIGLAEAAATCDSDVIEHQGVAVWTPWEPRLYDVELAVVAEDGGVVDRVTSSLGMRSIETRDGRVLLNGLPIYQRLVLDQGYFPGGGYTAVDDDALRGDIELAKALGFIGCRKHQKVEDPRWLHWADRLGFLVWEELPSAYAFTPRAVARATATWQEVVARDRNHPCIVAWVPVNESWGVPAAAWPTADDQRHHLRALYHLTHALDRTRLVVSNDGWEHAVTDLCTVHDYGDEAAVRHRFASRERALDPGTARRGVYAAGEQDAGAPLVVSEFGGVRLATDPGWGFSDAEDGDDLVARYRAYVEAVTGSADVVGFCWTQFTDVGQETNGLVTFDREPKAPIERVREATRTPRHDDG